MNAALLRSYAKRAAPSDLPELMDTETDYDVFRQTLASLASVNRLSGGYTPTLRFLDRIAERHSGGEPLRVLDMGSGYGDGVRAMAARLSERGIVAEITGVDLNPHAKRSAEAADPAPHDGVTVRYTTADVFDYAKAAPSPHVVTSALFMHHLEDDAIPRFLSWMDHTATLGWLVNDLYRSRFAAGGFAALATLLRRYPVVRHDGPVSFARSFRRDDWDGYLADAGVADARVFIGAPFRLCVEKVVD